HKGSAPISCWCASKRHCLLTKLCMQQGFQMKARAIPDFLPTASVGGTAAFSLAATECISGFSPSCPELRDPSGKSGIMDWSERLGRFVLSALMVLAVSGPAIALDYKFVVQ